MKSYFLDTSFLVDLVNEEEAALEKHEKVRGSEVTGSPCIYELSKFSQFSPGELFAGKEVLRFTPTDAAVAGDIYRRLEERGDLLGETDTMIAGMAANRGMVLITRDKGFEKVPGIETDFY